MVKKSKRRKSKKTFQERRKWQERFLYEALKLAPVYQDFRREHLEEIQAHIEWQKQADTNSPPELHSNYDLEFNVMMAFFRTPKGIEIIEKHGLWENRRSITVIPHQKAVIEKGKFYTIPWLEDGRYLTLRIDLKAPKERIIEDFSRELKHYYPKVQRPPIRHRGMELPESQEEMDRIFHAFNVVEKHGGNYLKATWELFPETNGEKASEDFETDKNLQQVKRWHKKVKSIISTL